jgi:subtilisin family serine protease
MKKVSYALALALVALSANAQSKLDAGSRMALDYFKQVQAGNQNAIKPFDLPFEVNALSRAESTASMFVSLKPGADWSKVEALDFEIITINGNIAVVNGPLNNVEKLAALDEVRSISFGSIAKPLLKKARAAINADEVHSGSDGLPQAYNGEGIITAIIDQGFDPNHPNFQDADGNTRVKALWSAVNGKTTLRNVEEYTTDGRNESHGTHTLGCMAGSFNKKGGKVAQLSDKGTVSVRSTVANPYYGISTNSDIIIGVGQLSSANIIANLDEIAKYAEQEGKPFVVNMSFGTKNGAHDSADLYSQSLSAYTKKGILFFAAGNEGDVKTSIRKTFTDSDNTVKTFITLPSSTTQNIIDIWASDSQDFAVSLAVYNLSTGKIEYSYDISTNTEKSVYVTSSVYSDASYVHNDAFDRAFSTSYVNLVSLRNMDTNNRREVSVTYQLTNNTETNKTGNYVLGFIVSGKPGQTIDIVSCDGDTEFVSKNQAGWTEGNPDFSITQESCVDGVISVGSFTTSTSWPTLGQLAYTSGQRDAEGGISYFSSYGQLIDGTTRPTVLSPGAAIISSISSYYTDANYSADQLNTCSALYTKNSRDYYWESEQGTSMACPVAAGTVALWLQADPTLTTEDVMNVIKQTSVQDEATLANPVKAGAGKINALAGIKYILGLNSVNSIAVDSADKMLVTSAGQNEWQVYVPGASAVKAALYSTSGQLVANVSANSDTAVINGNKLAKGIYILSANGKSQRVIVK